MKNDKFRAINKLEFYENVFFMRYFPLYVLTLNLSNWTCIVMLLDHKKKILSKYTTQNNFAFFTGVFFCKSRKKISRQTCIQKL